MKRLIIVPLLSAAALLMGATFGTVPAAQESAAYIPPQVETPMPTPARESRPNHDGFVSSLDARVQAEGDRPWFYDESKSREENIFSYLTEEAGLNAAAACGIIASMDVETGGTFNPNAENPISYGLCQWLGGRLDNLIWWCGENDEDYRSIDGQLAFLVWELMYDDPYGTWDELTSVEDGVDGAYRAGWYFCYWFERPLELNIQSNYRAYLATEYYRELA